MTTLMSARVNVVRNSSLSFLSLSVKSVEEEILLSSNHVDTIRS